jgi:hypothetical protein
MKTEPLGTLWICTDCIQFLANGERNEGADREPLSAVSDGVFITLGIGREDHDCEDPEDCECAVRPFSWSDCEGCGSPLGGERHGATLWNTLEV